MISAQIVGDLRHVSRRGVLPHVHLLLSCSLASAAKSRHGDWRSEE